MVGFKLNSEKFWKIEFRKIDSTNRFPIKMNRNWRYVLGEIFQKLVTLYFRIQAHFRWAIFVRFENYKIWILQFVGIKFETYQYLYQNANFPFREDPSNKPSGFVVYPHPSFPTLKNMLPTLITWPIHHHVITDQFMITVKMGVKNYRVRISNRISKNQFQRNRTCHSSMITDF